MRQLHERENKSDMEFTKRRIWKKHGIKLSITKGEVALNNKPNKQIISETQQTWYARKVFGE